MSQHYMRQSSGSGTITGQNTHITHNNTLHKATQTTKDTLHNEYYAIQYSQYETHISIIYIEQQAVQL
jgi:hypothetical protein